MPLVLAAGDDCIVNDNTDDSSVDAGVDAGVDTRGVDAGVDMRGIDTGVDTRGIDAGCINMGSIDSGSIDVGSLDDDNIVTSSESTQLMSSIAEERSKLGASVAFTHHVTLTLGVFIGDRAFESFEASSSGCCATVLDTCKSVGTAVTRTTVTGSHE